MSTPDRKKARKRDAAGPEPGPPSVGRNIRLLRAQRGLSLEKLSAQSRVSKAMLSQIEGDKVNPTVATVWKIARGLDVDFNALFKGESESIPRLEVHRREDTTKLAAPEKGVVIKVLSPVSMAEDLELYLLSLAPDSRLVSEPHFSGTEEFLTVLRGEVAVSVPGKELVLRAGDLARYDGDVRHVIENRKRAQAELYLVVCFNRGQGRAGGGGK